MELITRGVCFTYATMFALESLAIAGENHANSERVRRACDFLLGKQMPDGGWGETYMVSVMHSDEGHVG
jgi:lanosterol synthase